MRKATISLGISALALAAVVGIGQPVLASDSATTTVTGTLTAISGNTLPAILTVTAGATTYTVEVSTTTKIIRKYGGTSDLGEFLVGDTVEVKGVLSNDVANTLTATRLKNKSIQRNGGTFKGVVVMTFCDSNYFTYKPDNRDQQTVYFTASTKFTRGGEKIDCAGLVAGERTKVIGLWRPASNRIDANRVIVDMKTISGTITALALTDGGLPATLTVLTNAKKGTTWTVNVTSATKLYRHYLKTATIEEFLVGDKVEARGTRGTGNVLNAKWVRNSSLKVKIGDFQGTVLSVDATAKTFVFRVNGKKYGDITVTTVDATVYVDENGLRTFADVSVGDKLKVLGTYTSSTKTLAATRVFFKEAQ